MAAKMIEMAVLVSKTHTHAHTGGGVENSPRLVFASRLRSNAQVWDYFTSPSPRAESKQMMRC